MNYRVATLQPIHELLSRIRWDPQFGRAGFELGYLDKVRQRIVRVPFREVRFASDDRFAFQVMDADGCVHDVPYHRVREVYRDGVLIWRRPD